MVKDSKYNLVPVRTPWRKRKRRYRGRRRKRATAPTYTMRYPVPMKLKRTLRYMEDSFSLNPGIGGTAADYVFSANGLYDPNITGTGHQPIGFDQYMDMYNHYTVIGSKITVTFRNNDATYLQYGAIKLASDVTAIANGQESIENGTAKFTMLSTLATAGDKKTLTFGASVPKFMGRKSILSEDDFRGDVSNNPSEQLYYHILGFPNNTQDTGTITCHVIIDYITIFTEPKELSQS